MDADFASHLDDQAQRQAPAVRRAALMLHGLAEADRRWLLERLAPAQRQAIEPLLAELAELGIPRDGAGGGPVWPGAAAAPMAVPPDVAAPSAEPGRSPVEPVVDEPTRSRPMPAADDVLVRLSVAEAARLLADEPDGLVADVLAGGPYPWQAALLEALPGRRRRIEGLLGDATRPALAAHARSAMLHALAARAAGLAPAATGRGPAARRGAWWAHWRAWIARLRRTS